jgi:hypothetical protein
LLSVLFVAVAVAWLSGRIAWWVAFLVWGGACLVGLTAQSLTRGRIPEVELGPVVFSAVVWVRVRPARFNTSGFGYVRLLVSEGTIATRTRLIPRFVAKLFGTDYTLSAADFEVGTSGVGSASRGIGLVTWSFSVGPGQGMWDEAVVLKGPYGRGWLELEFFRSEKATPGEVQRELIRAGARPATGAVEG